MKTMKKGFTLIELLIVITIIGILAVAFLPQLLGAPSKARDTQRVADLQRVAGVLTQYSVNSNLPSDGTAGNSPDYLCVGAITELDEADFGGSIPEDPDPDNNFATGAALDCAGDYGYAFEPNTDFAFGLYAHVENFENANAECDDAFTGTIVDPVDATAADNLCYVILVQ